MSVCTSIHVFVGRYRLVAIPGIALCWGFAVSVFESRWLRLFFCVVLVAVATCHYFTSDDAGTHGYTWKYALEVAERNASPDNATVVLCSDLPEANYLPMPVGDAVKDSTMFGLPRGLNDEARRDGRIFLDSAVPRRFMVLGFWPSQPVLQWLSANAAATHTVRELGKFDNITVLEFTTPRN